jgi:hypothetical protein
MPYNLFLRSERIFYALSQPWDNGRFGLQQRISDHQWLIVYTLVVTSATLRGGHQKGNQSHLVTLRILYILI